MSTPPRVGLVWAQAEGAVIGRAGGLPWHVPEDLAHFTAITRGAPVVMGRATWESLPERFRPLPGRRNIVVTGRGDFTAPGAERAASVDEALALAAPGAPTSWIIGGGQLYAATIGHAAVLEVTEIIHPDGFAPAPGDVRAPHIDPARFRIAQIDPPVGAHTSRTGLRYRFVRYVRRDAGDAAVDALA